jgi:phytol kinase
VRTAGGIHQPLVLSALVPIWIAGLIGLVTMLAAVQWLHDRRGVDGEITRRIAHVLGALSAASLPLFMPMWAIVVVAGTFVTVMAVSRAIGSLTAVHDVARPSWGAWCFPLSIGVLAAAGPSTGQYVYGVLTMGLGDAAAGVVGQRWGTHPLPIRVKTATAEGSAAFVAVVAVVGAATAVVALDGRDWQLVVAALAAAIVLAAVEAVSPLGLDNLVLPLMAAALWGWWME